MWSETTTTRLQEANMHVKLKTRTSSNDIALQAYAAEISPYECPTVVCIGTWEASRTRMMHSWNIINSMALTSNSFCGWGDKKRWGGVQESNSEISKFWFDSRCKIQSTNLDCQVNISVENFESGAQRLQNGTGLLNTCRYRVDWNHCLNWWIQFPLPIFSDSWEGIGFVSQEQ